MGHNGLESLDVSFALGQNPLWVRITVVTFDI